MRAAIVGLGRIGFEFGTEKSRLQPASHLSAYDDISSVDKIALCDTDTAKLSQVRLILYSRDDVVPPEKKKFSYYSDVNQMLNEFQPEIVSVCTPTPTHAPLMKSVADCQSVKTIFLEKPIAQSLKEADEILLACKANNINLAVNYSRRWSTVYRELYNNISPIATLNIVGIHPGPLIRTGSHAIDLFNWLGFNPLKKQQFEECTVQAFGTPALAEYMQETEDFNINGFIDYGDRSATLIGNATTPQSTVLFELDAILKEKRIRITENGSRTEIYENRASKRYTNLNEYKRIFLTENGEENLLLLAIKELTSLGQKLNGHGYVCISNSISCTGLDGRRALQVALGLHYSATHGNKQITLNEVPYDYTVRSY